MSPSLLSSPPPFPAPVQNLASVCRERRGGERGRPICTRSRELETRGERRDNGTRAFVHGADQNARLFPTSPLPSSKPILPPLPTPVVSPKWPQRRRGKKNRKGEDRGSNAKKV